MPPADRERRLLRSAQRADGIVDHDDLLALGYSVPTIHRRRQAGRLVDVFRGVYLVPPHPLTPAALEVAALRACGPESTLALRSAAAEFGWMRWKGDVEVLCPTHQARRRHLHPRLRHVEERDVVIRRGRRVTSPHRTLADLATVLRPDALDRVVHEAEFRGALDVDRVREVLSRTPRRRWTTALEASLDRRRPLKGRLDSGLEKRFAHFLRTRGYPASEHGVLFSLGDSFARIDVLFRGPWLGIEVDSDTHKTERAFHADRERDLRFGVEHRLPIVRVTDDQLDHRPDELDELLWARLLERDPTLLRVHPARQK